MLLVFTAALLVLSSDGLRLGSEESGPFDFFSKKSRPPPSAEAAAAAAAAKGPQKIADSPWLFDDVPSSMTVDGKYVPPPPRPQSGSVPGPRPPPRRCEIKPSYCDHKWQNKMNSLELALQINEEFNQMCEETQVRSFCNMVAKSGLKPGERCALLPTKKEETKQICAVRESGRGTATMIAKSLGENFPGWECTAQDVRDACDNLRLEGDILEYADSQLAPLPEMPVGAWEIPGTPEYEQEQRERKEYAEKMRRTRCEYYKKNPQAQLPSGLDC